MRTLAFVHLAASLSIGAGLLTSCGGLRQAQDDTPSIGVPGAELQGRSLHGVAPQWQAQHLARAACPQVVGQPTCLVLQVVKNGISPACSPSKGCGFTATELAAAYGISKDLKKGSGTNVAVIEVGDYANASSDLAEYRSEYGLGTANLTRYNAAGQEYDYPETCQDYGWCLETALDIDMVSASCPKCGILLMEASSSVSSLEEAESSAVTLGATIVSNSWICYDSWDCGDSSFPKYFAAKGVAYLASTGDEVYGEPGGPAALASVIAVGGAQLAVIGSKYSETLWSDGGYGCATEVPKPSWQHDPDCKYRTVGDLSAEAGCEPGVAEYSSFYGGWTGVCGTSVGTPLTAGVIGLAGNASSWDANGGELFWTETNAQHKKYFMHPAGSVSSCGDYLCGDGRYENYFSGPGGWGSPKGIKGY
jgi:hypothetical protein